MVQEERRVKLAPMAGSGADRAVGKYLKQYAEPEAALATALPGEFGNAVVVPAYGEEDSLFKMLGSVAAGTGTDVLVVLVLNARADSSEDVHRANSAARERLSRELPSPQEAAQDESLLSYPLEHGRLVLVDRARSGRYLPEGQGVGLARKIGFDVALALKAAGRIASDWIHSTDADTVLPRDYFEQTETSRSRGNERGCLLLRAPLRSGPGARRSGAPLRDLVALLRARTRLGGFAVRVPQHGKLSRHLLRPLTPGCADSRGAMPWKTSMR